MECIMTVSKYELLIRSRLRDTNYENLEWSKNEIMDILNLGYIELVRNLKFLTKKINLRIMDNEIDLPYDFLEILEIRVNNDRINPVNINTFYRNVPMSSFTINGKKVIFSNDIRGRADIVYHAFDIIWGYEDEFEMPEICTQALLFYSMFLLLQKTQNERSLQDSIYYKKLYEEELVRLKNDVFRIYDVKDLRSTYIKY